jgi:hypothetical protein
VRVERAATDGVVVQDRCLEPHLRSVPPKVTRMLLGGGSHPVDDGDPIDWLRGKIVKSPIPTLTGLRDAPWVQTSIFEGRA